MESRLRTGLVYSVGTDVLEHDEELDAELYTFDTRDVFRGSVDPAYTSYNLDVHWLYNDNSERVGLVEYESDDFSTRCVLWYYDNPFATLLQDSRWVSNGKTLWSYMSAEAYQDCLEDDFKHVVERSKQSRYQLVFPATFHALRNENPILFVDDLFIVYTSPQAEPSDDGALASSPLVAELPPPLPELPLPPDALGPPREAGAEESPPPPHP